MAHKIKIAGASYADVDIVRLTDTSGTEWDYIDADAIWNGGITVQSGIAITGDIDGALLGTADGDVIAAKKVL